MTLRAASILFVLTLASCDNNIAALWDRRGDAPTEGAISAIQVIPVGGVTKDGRPRVEASFPTGGGWPDTVPIVVVFDESMNLDSIAPPQSSSEPAQVFVRAEGSEEALPATYDFLLGDTVVLIRPAAPLRSPTGGAFEVVVGPDARDADGIRFGGSDVEVVATFTTDAPEDETEGRIVTTLPLDDATDRIRETRVFAVFTRPVESSSVTPANFVVRPAGGAAISGTIDYPLESAPTVEDTRVLEFTPTGVFGGGTTLEVVVDDTIQFENGVLDFGNRTPFASFRTITPTQPAAVRVGNAAMGFEDKISASNVSNLLIDVDFDANAAVGDRAVVRIYGSDASTDEPGDLAFEEREAEATVDGAQTVTVDFGAALGTAAAPRFDEGSIAICTQLRRGRRQTGFIRSDANNDPRLDVTPPTLVSIGPPNGPDPTDAVIDQEHLVITGLADEPVARGSITVGSETAGLFASSDDSRFTMYPVRVGALPGTTADYALTITDVAGNISVAQTGRVVQRGVVAGVQSGMLTVEAYDESDFAVIAGATVVVEPGLPTKPATGQLVMSTGADGRATFSGLAAASYTVTVVADGYDVVSLVDTPTAFASLPLRPVGGATASLTAAFAHMPVPQQTLIAGVNTFADPTDELIPSANPLRVDPFAVRPNRPIVLSAFVGNFPPTSVTTFTGFSCAMCGADGETLTPPLVGAPAGASSEALATIIDEGGASLDLATPITVNFGSSTGLGTIVGDPVVAIVNTLRGFGGASLGGIGFASSAGGTSYTVDGSYAIRINQALPLFAPTLWVSTTAADAAGNVARVRALVLDQAIGNAVQVAATPGIPTIQAPAGPSAGAPSVTFADRLDAATIPGGLAIGSLRATDDSGRRWTLLWQDVDPTSVSKTLQFPDLSGTSATALAAGTWTISGEDTAFVSVTQTVSGWLLEERFREVATWARSTPEAFTVQ